MNVIDFPAVLQKLNRQDNELRETHCDKKILFPGEKWAFTDHFSTLESMQFVMTAVALQSNRFGGIDRRWLEARLEAFNRRVLALCMA